MRDGNATKENKKNKKKTDVLKNEITLLHVNKF